MAGIFNLNKNCYVSAVLQCLAAIPPAVKMLKEHYRQHEDERMTCVQCKVSMLFDRVNLSGGKAVEAEMILDILRDLDVNYNEPGDVREFFVTFVRLHAPCLQFLFNINLELTVSCSLCGEPHISNQSTIHVSFPDNEYDLQTNLNLQFDMEEVEGFLCANCQIPVKVNTFKRLQGNPKYICVHEITAKYQEPLQEIQVKRETYELCGFIEFRPVGRQTSKNVWNHYIAYRRIGSNWFKFDDTEVSIVKLHTRYKMYMLFYRHTTTTYPFELEIQTDDYKIVGFPRKPKASPKADPRPPKPREEDNKQVPSPIPQKKSPDPPIDPVPNNPVPKKPIPATLQPIVQLVDCKEVIGTITSINCDDELFRKFADQFASKGKEEPIEVLSGRGTPTYKRSDSPEYDPLPNPSPKPKRQRIPSESESEDQSQKRKGKGKRRGRHTRKKYYIVKKKRTTGKEKDTDQVDSNTMGKRCPRGDGVDERHQRKKYKYVRWNKCKPASKVLHRSHQYSSKRKTVVSQQPIPGYCVLCPRQGYMWHERRAIQHYNDIHNKTAVTVGKVCLLRCRCSDVRSRGSDGRIRNAHYHCPECWKPCDQQGQLAIHLISRHHKADETVKHMLLRSRKK